MINAPDQIFVKRHDDEHVIRTLTKVLDDASSSHRKLDPSEGLQDAQLDDGARLHIVHRDIGRGSHTIVNVRNSPAWTFVKHHSCWRQALREPRDADRSVQAMVGGGRPLLTLSGTAPSDVPRSRSKDARLVAAGSPF